MTGRLESNSNTSGQRRTPKPVEEGSLAADGVPAERLAKIMKMRRAIRQDDFEKDALNITIDRVGRELGIR